MTDSTLNVTQALDSPEKHLKIIDNGDATYSMAITPLTLAGLNIPKHDYIALGYTGSNLTTVVYKTGGASGPTVATLTLAYTGSDLVSVTRT